MHLTEVRKIQFWIKLVQKKNFCRANAGEKCTLAARRNPTIRENRENSAEKYKKIKIISFAKPTYGQA
jgi:hypothetical protein